MKRTILIIMDGWGINKNPKISAIEAANTPFVDTLYEKYPNTTLITHGESVGLPFDQMGNSEVGHMNIGAGRVIYQELLKINNSIKSGEFNNNKTLLDALTIAKENKKTVHLMGLISDGGIHSHINHLKAIIDLVNTKKIENVYIWGFTDGRDTDPRGGLDYISDLQNYCKNTTIKFGGLVGRYYAMDRDKRWERIKLAYDLLTSGNGIIEQDPIEAINNAYSRGETDEFVKPISIVDEKGHKPIIREGDIVISFNYRTDRCREITEVLTQSNHPNHGMNTMDLHYLTMTVYDEKFKNVHPIFTKENTKNTLGEIISKNGLSQLRIAETEKYPHVSFFFSGGREQTFAGEERIMIPSPKVATYDLQPEMSAIELKDTVIDKINKNKPNFICLNFANTDMVGHTGVFSAAVKAAETVDKCVELVVCSALENGYTVFLTADHGNADYMVNPDGSPNTAHSKNLVPFFLINKQYKGNLKPGKLADIAPTILSFLGLEIPTEMTGEILLEL